MSHTQHDAIAQAISDATTYPLDLGLTVKLRGGDRHTGVVIYRTDEHVLLDVYGDAVSVVIAEIANAGVYNR